MFRGVGQSGKTTPPADLVFTPPKILDALRFHITEIRGVRDFIGSHDTLQRLQERNIILRIAHRQWQSKTNIGRLLWLLDQSRTSYRVNDQNVAILSDARTGEQPQ